MLTDKDIHDIKALAYKSGMDYFVQMTDRGYKPYHQYWTPCPEGWWHSSRNNYALVQRLDHDGHTLYAVIDSWQSIPSFTKFEWALYSSGRPLQSLHLRDIYRNLHPDFDIVSPPPSMIAGLFPSSKHAAKALKYLSKT